MIKCVHNNNNATNNFPDLANDQIDRMEKKLIDAEHQFYAIEWLSDLGSSTIFCLCRNFAELKSLRKRPQIYFRIGWRTLYFNFDKLHEFKLSQSGRIEGLQYHIVQSTNQNN